MANAMVEKLKSVGIRHGEKAGVGLAATLFFLFLVMAIAKPTISLTADEVKGHASAADQNLNKPQSESDILSSLENEGVKNPEFAKKIDQQAVVSLDAGQFELVNPWATPEPGAGMIRDTPLLLAATDLYARAGRGGALLYALDEDGAKIVLMDSDLQKQQRRSLRRRRGRRTSGMMGGMSGGAPGYARSKSRNRKSQAEIEAEKKKDRKREQRKIRESLAGEANPDKEKDAEKDQDTGAQENYKEITKGVRWVAIVGTFDNKQQRQNYATALKLDYASVYPDYERLDVERQERQADGNWSDWQLVNRDENTKILYNVPEIDDELTPDEVRLQAISDRLPFLRAGLWKGVHVASLVPKEKRDLPKEEPNANNPMGGMYGASGRRGMNSSYGNSGASMGFGEGGPPRGFMRGSSGGGGASGYMDGGAGMPGA
ncbi:MAG TPA: hypothetical protein VGY53_02770, partial [Isosphaeraceae bacterium]|nr:hypothetical protein [Isosphaeraceae bacterium]